MPVDVRREIAHINKEYESYYRVIGEEVVWFRFDTVNSRWDDVYDEGGNTYLPGVRIPALWIDQIEDPEQYSGEGRRPRQRLRFAVSAEELKQRGIGAEEAHGRRIYDEKGSPPRPAQVGRPLAAWLDDRLNDVVYYDGRYYAISNFQIRGRAQYTDAIVGVSALEEIVEDETIYDFFPSRTQFGIPIPPPDTVGMPLIAFTGQDNEFGLDFEAYNLTGSSWTLRVFSDGTEMATMAIDATQQATGLITATLGQAAVDALGEGEFQWNLTQQFGVASSVVLDGTLFVVGSVPEALALDVGGDNLPKLDLEAVVGFSAVWSLYFDVDLSGSVWSAILEDDGDVVGEFAVDWRFQADGIIVVMLPRAVVDALIIGKSYVWKLVQTVSPEPPLLVARGALMVQEA